ncbi:hypothetical protein CLM85_13965 [Streptomyces albidoflavus]|uniref:hypothetical protein n=1 Tax=Streptomyces albidoflavus TaxID=1886 RepID=UPI000BAE06E1|nr:hypothetical protein [Streptomyces albidoflavus]PAX86620.1 hypothetical protein CLM81_08815 [Streptomyces albidoflavus]PBO18789.1 hypothetical protein CLM83_10215 [Streptomyces albidoflavus]PBO23809.1 hypothetical protein CLM85_13965 [Streptomyces albidoflavus]
MDHRRARTYAVCAVKLDEDHTDAPEGTFDAAVTNALVAIVAREWPGKEKKGSRTKSAIALLELIKAKAKAQEEGTVVRPAPDEPDVFLIGDHDADLDHDAEEPAALGASAPEGIFAWQPPAALPRETRVDAGVLKEAVLIAQAIRHAREDGGGEGGEHRVLERRHVDALLALDDHPSLWALSREQEHRYEISAEQQDERERERACRTLERIGEEEAERRAAVAEDLHIGPTPDDPGALGLLDCSVCGSQAFSSDGGDDLGMGVGAGECLVCHYRRSPAIANALAREMEWERRRDRD